MVTVYYERYAGMMHKYSSLYIFPRSLLSHPVAVTQSNLDSQGFYHVHDEWRGDPHRKLL